MLIRVQSQEATKSLVPWQFTNYELEWGDNIIEFELSPTLIENKGDETE